MISLKKYLDTISPALEAPAVHDLENILSLTLAAYQSALLEMGICSLDACPALGLQLKQGLGEVEESLSMGMSGDYEVAIQEGATLVRVGSALVEGVA